MKLFNDLRFFFKVQSYLTLTIGGSQTMLHSFILIQGDRTSKDKLYGEEDKKVIKMGRETKMRGVRNYRKDTLKKIVPEKKNVFFLNYYVICTPCFIDL